MKAFLVVNYLFIISEAKVVDYFDDNFDATKNCIYEAKMRKLEKSSHSRCETVIGMLKTLVSQKKMKSNLR